MKPVLQAILLADHVYVDKGTGKHVVAGVFDRLSFIPKERMEEAESAKENVVLGGMQAGSPWAFLSITDVRGEQGFALRYVFLDDDQVIFQTKFTIKSEDPLKTYRVVAPLPPLPSRRAGTFALEVIWNDEPIGTYRVLVAEASIGRQNNVDG